MPELAECYGCGRELPEGDLRLTALAELHPGKAVAVVKLCRDCHVEVEPREEPERGEGER